ncbi:hypothetical protein LOTGIDRAFT_167513 [Lottia gigantea]|uniref:Mediator of RNA polymerase II transcription subunit 23 n=1 Tax=Lottia gigantea TaxID=225164 RepID=V4BAK9_LOTGI|nr:hypothetical protein LOTGIDRAFT_167513 [Lottia gigantea]ESO86009.1 hypothetical protein LOTGIDRAFT_167513 [Lottia gigantea]
MMECLDEILKKDIEQAFSNQIIFKEGDYGKKVETDTEKIKAFLQTVPSESLDFALQTLVKCIYLQRNKNRLQLLCKILESLVETNTISAKPVSDHLLAHEGLTYTDELHWKATFKTLRNIVGGVHYKEARDLLKIVLEKCQEKTTETAGAHATALNQIDESLKVIEYILDRNACLLPGYFAMNEISKVCLSTQTWPHWRLGRILSDYITSFEFAAQMVSICGRRELLPVVGHSIATNNVWRLNSYTLAFVLNGPLPYEKELTEPQTALMRYVLQQPYSREMASNMLGLNKQAKQRCEALENQLVDQVVMAIERCEEGHESGGENDQLLWQHLSSQLIYFVLFQFASFPHMVTSLYEKLKGKNLKKGRDNLMWVLLQFISGSIQKNSLADFLPVMKLYDLLYSDSEIIPIPDVTMAHCTHAFAGTCIWIHIDKKAQSDNVQLHRPIPLALRDHLQFLVQTLNMKNLVLNDFKVALLCNAYSTDTTRFSIPMGHLLECIYGNNKTTTLLPGNVVASAPIQPLSMSLLDSLTVHVKMSLIHSIVSKVMKLAKSKSHVALAPSLVKTYSRLLVYTEIESLGIKGFIGQLLPNVFSYNAIGIIHTLLEMFSYRMHHIQIHYRVQLLSYLNSMVNIQPANQNQLHLCVETTALRLITSMGSAEVQPHLSRISNEPKGILAGESEELNRVLVLTIARAMHITGADSFSTNWAKDILISVVQSTPLGWPQATLQCFPTSLSDFFNQTPVQREDKNVLKKTVETEYRKWKSMANENDIISLFSMQGKPPLFLCIIWKNLIEEKRVTPTAYKVLDRLGPRALATHLRTFVDFLVYEVSLQSQQVNRYVEAVNDMIWKCNIITIDRLILCLVLRNMDSKESTLRFVLTQLILLQGNDFKERVHEFVKDNSPEHWQSTNCHEKHMNFHRTYPEKFYFEGIQDMNSPIQHQYLPVYFGNVCLRFLPVLDVLIHRMIENTAVHKVLENILEQIGCLFKFHDRPITYLYNTYYYYEKLLADRPALKRKLLQTVIGAFSEIRPKNWCISESYLTYLGGGMDDMEWKPDAEYYLQIAKRLSDTLTGVSPAPFPDCDWRFNEFPNPAAHALYVSCVELMALPVSSQIVGAGLLDIVLKSSTKIPRNVIMSWMNAVGLIITSLPESCWWPVLSDRIIKTLQGKELLSLTAQSSYKLFEKLNFKKCYDTYSENESSTLLCLCHAIWHHAGIGQLSLLPNFLKDKVKPIAKREEQLIYVCHLVGPFLQRLHAERTRSLLDLTVELYQILLNVDKACERLQFMDPISDFLYHIKYMFVGDGVKSETENVIRNLSPSLQLRLRFISHIINAEQENKFV